jgi:hypothetical protein
MISSVLLPAALLSFTLLLNDFLQRQGMDWEKVHYAKLGYFLAISGNSGIQKGRAHKAGNMKDWVTAKIGIKFRPPKFRLYLDRI